MNLFQGVNAVVNAAVRPLVASRRWGPLVGRWMTLVTYTGRRSGRTFSVPVGFAGQGDEVKIAVLFPERKTWWRNFLGAGGPVSLRLHGVDRAGHAVTHRDDRGRVTVAVRLDPAAR